MSAPVSPSSLTLDPIDAFVFQGLQKQFLSVFNTPTVWTTSTDKTKALAKLFPEKIAYPHAFLFLETWTTSETRRSLRASTLRGTRVAVSTDNKTTQNVRILPVDYEVKIEWHFNSYQNVLAVGRKWLFLANSGALNFQVDYGQSVFDIRSELVKNVTFPQREADPDNVQEYVLETSLTLQGYISEAETFQQQVIDTVEITGYVGKVSSVSEAWSFKTPSIK